MKTSEFKTIMKDAIKEVLLESEFTPKVKESMKEVINEELRDILLEALKNNNSIPQQNPVISPYQENITEVRNSMREQMNNSMLKDIMGDRNISMNSSVIQGTFNPALGVDSGGELSLDQIKKLMNNNI